MVNREEICPPVVEGASEQTPLFVQGKKRRAINYSDNVLLAYRAEIIKGLSWSNFMGALLSLTYCGLNMTLFYVNYENARAKSLGLAPPVDKNVFHLSEFWGTFFFSLVEVYAITQTPKTLVATVNNTSPRLLKVILFVNVVATLIPAILVTVNLEYFEILSHELEYASEISMSFLELVILWSLLHRNRKSKGKTSIVDSPLKTGIDDAPTMSSGTGIQLSIMALAVSVVQLGIYNCLGRTPTGGMRGEVPAHACEFLFEIISSFITVWFCLDNMLTADEELATILFGDHEDCKVCATHVIGGSPTRYMATNV